MNFYPNNTLTNYTTKLKVPIQLQIKFEVALTEIIYPFNFKYRQDASINFVNTVTNQKETYRIQFYAFDTVTQLFQTLNDYLKFKSVSVVFYYNKNTHKVSIRVSAPWTVEFTDDVHKELGIKYSLIQSPNTEYTVFGIQQIPDFLNSVNSLYVYSDLIENQFIGDTFAPILRVVQVPHRQVFGEYICETYTTPHYVPVKKEIFDSIEIDIKSDTGEPIRFSTGKLVIKLHFKPMNYGF
jgi:hypothetical protein